MSLLTHERGFLLVAALLISVVLVVLGAASSFLTVSGSSVTSNVRSNLQARYTAEGAVDAAIAFVTTPSAGGSLPEFNQDLVDAIASLTVTDQNNVTYTAALVGTALSQGIIPPQGGWPAPPANTTINPLTRVTTGTVQGYAVGCYSDGIDGVASRPGRLLAVDNRNNPFPMMSVVRDASGNVIDEVFLRPGSDSNGSNRSLTVVPLEFGATLGGGNFARFETHSVNPDGSRNELKLEGVGNNISNYSNRDQNNNGVPDSGSTHTFGSLCLCSQSTQPPASNPSAQPCPDAPVLGTGLNQGGAVTATNGLLITANYTNPQTEANYVASVVLERVIRSGERVVPIPGLP
ncbi:MAG: hypothetical protein HC926_05575, partial [Synechococcaceae cyanobacterium SM2_3_60]|nr:hypothetical protein [Synechococcaceae cyanobacterium SM2_3_60]